jgi:hypothetical protein
VTAVYFFSDKVERKKTKFILISKYFEFLQGVQIKFEEVGCSPTTDNFMQNNTVKTQKTKFIL